MLLDSAPRTWGTREELHLRFSRALMAHGVRPVLVFSENLPEELRNRYRAGGIEVATISYRKGVFHYYQELGNVIKNYSVTTVHIAFFDYFSLIPWLARLRGVRYIVYHARNGGMLKARSLKKRVLKLRTHVTTHPLTQVIAVSEYLKQLLVEVGLPEGKVVVVHHGIDTRYFSPDPNARMQLIREFSIRPEDIILAMVSYLKPIKNCQVIVEACGQLVKRGLPARLFVAGDGEMRAGLEALSQDLGIADRIHWLGHVPDPVPLLQACDIFLMASVGEAFGLVLAEAMACGAPVVATRSGAILELVADGITGLLVPPLDALAFADAIQKLTEDEPLRRQMALRGLERVRRYFTLDASIEKMMDVYQSMWCGQET